MWLVLAADITVWIILYISPPNYKLYPELDLLLYNKFGCEKNWNIVS